MTFHENFWITVGAAAPVVALAAVVSFTDGIRVVESVNDLGRTAKVDWPTKNAERGVTVLASLFVISAANIILQVVALALALTALAQGHNSVAPVLLVVGEPLSVLLLLVTGILTAWLRFLGPRKAL